MKGDTLKRVSVICLIIVIAMAFCGCRRETDEDRVKQVLQNIQAAAEKKDVNSMMNRLSKTYSDPRGQNHDEIRGMLTGYFFRYPKISVYVNGLEISVDQTSARALFQAVLISGEKTGSVSDVIPQSLGIWDFDVSLIKESGRWQVVRAQWQESEVMKPEE